MKIHKEHEREDEEHILSYRWDTLLTETLFSLIFKVFDKYLRFIIPRILKTSYTSMSGCVCMCGLDFDFTLQPLFMNRI